MKCIMPWQVFQLEDNWENRDQTWLFKRRDLIQGTRYKGLEKDKRNRQERVIDTVTYTKESMGDTRNFTYRPEARAASPKPNPHRSSYHGDVPPKAREREKYILFFPLPSLSRMPTMPHIGRTYAGVTQRGSLGKQMSRGGHGIDLKANEQMTSTIGKNLQDIVMHHIATFWSAVAYVYDDGLKRL